MSNESIKIQVSGIRESEKSIGALTKLTFSENGEMSTATNLVWFPKSICQLEKIEPKSINFLPKYFITAPKWFLDKTNIKYDEPRL